jgi:uncharacterized SAM-binding protein YcdF (DUF218 family)
VPDRRRGHLGVEGIATVLVVLGGGVDVAGGRYALTPASAARVRATVDYVRRHEDLFAGAGARVVFSGGWSHAAAAPPPGFREGDLMREAAVRAGLDRHADLHAETRSRSTLDNLAHCLGDGHLHGCSFTPTRPLGVVTHAWHLPRVRYLAGRVLRLHPAALRGIPAAGGDRPVDRLRERAVHLGARLCFLGADDPAALLRRQERMGGWPRRV